MFASFSPSVIHEHEHSAHEQPNAWDGETEEGEEHCIDVYLFKVDNCTKRTADNETMRRNRQKII